ncbi:MAG: NAD(P)/FAD-dependent oxidoreductase [Flavobacteriaceae bacterium]|nr:NAD(P)/FAD-dependent oxidoreductase [Flavobacteriaceae bacterium]MCY4268280.1 NAD(P)/FAD-dependent oxidoreductase [Flavobacteriaceae bacterium]MCY4298506.1 NAD(P)/FAD-dependent oxidoreductase [Flavobacteriaceae bacterium]
MIRSDILIIGAGPAGLFAVFQAGLLKLKCHLIDSLGIVGGQCSELYPKKPIYDIPGYPEIMSQDLIDKLMEQIQPFHPGFSLGQSAETLTKTTSGEFIVTTNKGVKHSAPVVIIAGGLGSFQPRKPPIKSIAAYEGNGVDYHITNPEKYRNKRIVIAGGGDSALDWTIYLSKIAKELLLIHRRDEFRGALDSVNQVQSLKDQKKIELMTPGKVIGLKGEKKLDSLTIDHDGVLMNRKVDFLIPLFGQIPKLGPITKWGLKTKGNAIVVNNSLDYQTNIEGIYAIGDINTYPGKLKLILCGFHEAAITCHSVFKKIHPDKNNTLKYTTVTGVQGFDGSQKSAKPSVVKKIK